jgi:hypothetical protein
MYSIVHNYNQRTEVRVVSMCTYVASSFRIQYLARSDFMILRPID